MAAAMRPTAARLTVSDAAPTRATLRPPSQRTAARPSLSSRTLTRYTGQVPWQGRRSSVTASPPVASRTCRGGVAAGRRGCAVSPLPRPRAVSGDGAGGGGDAAVESAVAGALAGVAGAESVAALDRGDSGAHAATAITQATAP